MKGLFEAYFLNSLSLSMIALLIMAFSPLLSRRYSAKCRYYLWVVVFAVLLLPIRPQINIPLPEFLRPILPSNAAGVSTMIPLGAGMPASGIIGIPNAANTRDWFRYAGLLWGTGVICFLGWHIFQHSRFLSSVKRWSEDIEEAAVLELFARAKGELGIQNNIVVKSCACIKTPMLVGLLRPMVLIPQRSFHQDELPLILKHELIHHKRGDLWYKVLMMLALSIHWFNPVIYLTVKSALNLCEISCDGEVLKEVDAKGRAEYGEAIIGAIRNGGARQTVFSTNFYSGTKGMKQRIYAMMDMTVKRFSPVLLFVILMITLCGATTFALSPAQAKDMADSGLSNTEIQPSRNASIPDTDESTAARSEIKDRNLPANEAVPGNDGEYPEMNLNFMIVSREVKSVLCKDGFNSLIGLYCYDENGGVKMTPEMAEALENAH
jgi:bla regulator protein BlaR1